MLVFPQQHNPIEANTIFDMTDQACVDDKVGFLREISLMKSVGKHENIVGIVGHSTINCDRMMLLTEYCSEGNLLNYLK